MKIKLTDEQLELVIQAKTKAHQKTYDDAVAAAKKIYEDAVKLLRTKYQYGTIDIEGDEPVKKRGSYDEEQFILLVNEGKKSSEIAEIMGITPTYASIKKGKLIKDGKLKGKVKK